MELDAGALRVGGKNGLARFFGAAQDEIIAIVRRRGASGAKALDAVRAHHVPNG